MVEHNLAKVGVASSNLVSRSILFLALLFTYIQASQSIKILPNYCIDGQDVRISHFYKQTLEDKTLFTLPNTSTSFEVPSLKIEDYFKTKGFKVEDLSGGVIRFNSFCKSDKEMVFLQEHLRKVYLKTYPNIRIDSIKVTPKKPLPENFSRYEFIKALISKSKLKKCSGVFVAYYKDLKNLQKTIYFNFETRAFLPVFISTSPISHNSTLHKSHFKQELAQLKDIPSQPLLEFKSDSLVAKFNIKSQKILLSRQFNKKADIAKGSYVKGVLVDGKLRVQTEVKALQSGNIGDTIRVKNSKNITFNALIKKKDLVIIR